MSAIFLYVTGLLCGILVAYSSAQLPGEISEGCDGFWETSNVTHACYHFNFPALTWKAARESCQVQGGDLLSITNQGEQDYISERLKNVNASVWIGLNHMDGIFGWQWSDGSALAFINGRMGAYSWDVKKRECGMYSTRENKWSILDCNSKLSYVCKKYLMPRQHELYENWKYYPTRCESGWIPYNRRCCKLQKQELTWSEAFAACRSNGELMSVNSLADVEFVLHILNQENVTEAWIGLHSLQSNPVEFQWSDGSAVTFSSWQTFEPNIIKQRDNDLCVTAHGRDGNWRVTSCNIKLFSVCMRPGIPGVDPSDEQCAENWVRYRDYCYGTNLLDQSFQTVALDSICPPATITNRFEQAFINSLIYGKIIPEDQYFWIALQDINRTGEYSWLANGKEDHGVSFTNWDMQEPSDFGGCVVLSSGSNIGQWRVKDCRDFTSKSLCKKSLRAEAARESNPHEGNMDQACMPSWDTEPYLRYCYKVFHHEKLTRKRTWQEAEDLCQDFGAHLVSLSSMEEHKFLEELLSTMFNGDRNRKFWIGFNGQISSSKGTWEWSDGNQVVSPFSHDTDPNDDNCAAIRADTQLELVNCNLREEWICKISKGVIPKIPDWHIKDIPWVFFQGNNYCFYDVNTDFVSAEFICGSMKGEVTSIFTEAEQVFIHRRIKQISTEKQNWWIGLVNEYDGFHSWRDGSSVLYTNWKIDPQSNAKSSKPVGDKQCVYMESDTGLWSISDCRFHHPGICKTNVTFKMEKHHPPLDTDHDLDYSICPDGWLYYGNKCFLVSRDDGMRMDWYAAAVFCREHGGGLATITDEIEQAFIVMQLFEEERGFWIGVSKDDLWNNGTVEIYNNWSPTGFPNNGVIDRDQLCPLISANHNIHPSGKWYLDKCSPKGYGFICEKEEDYYDPAVTSSDLFPISNTMEYGHKTYRIISGNMSWYEASTACQDFGDKLISINDQYHQAFVTILVHRLGYPHWIGFFSPDSTDKYMWMDGAKSHFTSWADEESPSHGSCVYIDTSGHWRAEDCDTHLQGALCLPSTGPGYKYTINNGTGYNGAINNDTGYNGAIYNDTGYNDNRYNDTGYNVPSDECPEEWLLFNHFCYSISTALHNEQFYKAEKFCKKQGGEILKILTEKEQSFLHHMVKTFIVVPSIWLSRITSHGKGKVNWSDGSLVHYSKWNEENMRAYGLVGDYCMIMWMEDGSWKIAQCNETRGFICKKGNWNSSVDTNILTATNHSIMPTIVVTTVVISILLIVLWHLLINKKCISRSLNIQRLQSMELSRDTNYVELCTPIAGLNDSEKQ